MDTHTLTEILILLAAAVITVPLFQWLRLGPILGYICAGAAIGPWGLSLITDVTEMRHIAEYGVVFLLFIIGIELNPARLWQMRRLVFGLGAAQVVLTGVVLGLLLWLSGANGVTATVLGMGLALSSTAMGLQILKERGELNTRYGQAGFAILLFQDLAVVPMLAVVPLLAQRDASLAQPMGVAIAESIALLAGVLVAGRYLLNPLFRFIAARHNEEVFAAAALLVVLATGAALQMAGLSMAMGAFLAGLLLAESAFRHQVIADIEPFRGPLLGLFFMAVGMSLDFGLLVERWLLILPLLLALVALKAMIIWTVCSIAGLRRPNALAVALLLAQAGEFGVVLFGLANSVALLPAPYFQMAMLVVTCSMAITPGLAALISWMLERHAQLRQADQPHEDGMETSDVAGHVIIAGFGRVGERIARMLAEAGVSYIAIDRDPDRVFSARGKGYRVFYGDARREDVLQAVGAPRARSLVVTLDDLFSAESIVGEMHHLHPSLAILVRAHNSERGRHLLQLGADEAVSETLEASLQLGSLALARAGIDPQSIAELSSSLRREKAPKPVAD